jgi:hypothetical protein
MTAADNEILVIPCHGSSHLHRLSVDDFADPAEREITSEQIHLTVIRMGPTEEPEGCFALSVTSARQLVRELRAAIRRREEASR